MPSKDTKQKRGEIFRYHPINLLLPGVLLFVSFVIITQKPELYLLKYALLIAAILSSAIALVRYKKIIVTDQYIGIKSIQASEVYSIEHINFKERKTELLKGQDIITWTLFLQGGFRVTIKTDLYSHAKKLNRSLTRILKHIPDKNHNP